MSNYQYTQQKYLVDTYVNRGLTLVRGDGVLLFDEQGTQYLDLMSNYGVNILGHNHPILTQALSDQLHRLTALHSSFANDARTEASEALIARCGEAYARVYWSNSGAEAIEAALKFAVLATNKRRFIVAGHSYHGKTLGALSATEGEKYSKPFQPLLWEFVRVPFDDTAALEAAINDETTGFIIEPIQGEGGIHIPDAAYLARAREICTQKNILLVIDEIQTGCGRTGTFLASQGVAGDILCLGKGLGGGVPVGATVVNQAVAGSIPKHIHTSTFGGNPLACRGVVTTLRLLDDARLTHVREIGDYFVNQLRALQPSAITAVRGKGLMIGIAVGDQRNTILKQLQDKHVLAIPAGEDVIRFLPALIIEKSNIDSAIDALRTLG